MKDITEKNIFFLDDEPTVREVVRETLEDSNFNVSCFGNPFECLAQLRSKKCDLLVTDLKMPEKDGIELLTDVQHLAPWVPVLMITGYGDIPTAVKAMKAGAVDFIEKPLEKKDFVRKIRSILKKHVSTHPDLGTTLTRTEKKILQLVIDGKSNKEIAFLLHRSARTIEVHRSHLMHKLGVDNLVDLVKRVASMGLIDLEEKQPSDEDKPESEIGEEAIPKL
ncbi:MAG: response regulator transcription factor [Planctomycetota bacterium]|jgi:FixJ family two-component response regulator